jgi:hypothetical protein
VANACDDRLATIALFFLLAALLVPAVLNPLNRAIGAAIYNFGSDGYFGPLQYYLIYKDLAKQFEHDGVILFFCRQMISRTMTTHCGRIFIRLGIGLTLRN